MSSRLARRTSSSADVVAVLRGTGRGRTGGVGGGVHVTARRRRVQRTSASVDDPPGQLVGRAVGDDGAAGQDQDAVGQLLGLVEVVRGQQDRGVVHVGQSVHQVVELAPRLGVEAGGRLVEEQQLGPADDADGDVEPAALPAGELAGPACRRARSARPPRSARRRPRAGGSRRRVGGVVASRGGRAARAPATCRGRARTAAPRRAGPATPRRRAPGRRRARVTCAGRAHPEAFEDLDRRGLAGAVGPEQRQHLARAGP